MIMTACLLVLVAVPLVALPLLLVRDLRSDGYGRRTGEDLGNHWHPTLPGRPYAGSSSSMRRSG